MLLIDHPTSFGVNVLHPPRSYSLWRRERINRLAAKFGILVKFRNAVQRDVPRATVYTENLIGIDDVMESPKLAE